MENNTLCNRHSLGVNNHTKMYVTYTRIYGWSDYGGESSYQPGYRLENMMWMTLLVYDYIIPGEKDTIILIDEPEISLNVSWQREFLDDMKEIVDMNKISLIIATHSPQIINDNWELVDTLGEFE